MSQLGAGLGAPHTSTLGASMRTDTCALCNETKAVSGPRKVHWLSHLGIVVISLGLWAPLKLCQRCEAWLAMVGIVGMLIAITIALIVGFKMLAPV